ncbi:hypothetical protein CHARACLAT_008347 [Characodon lateralis]|uniref:Uncharacterized protein n=1 Tax=Characodon lateralis TaxID=208331 RepID=A0ABU7EHD4_9TELE|nr:hypothetical protein [Characodon lateralis]
MGRKTQIRRLHIQTGGSGFRFCVKERTGASLGWMSLPPFGPCSPGTERPAESVCQIRSGGGESRERFTGRRAEPIANNKDGQRRSETATTFSLFFFLFREPNWSPPLLWLRNCASATLLRACDAETRKEGAVSISQK